MGHLPVTVEFYQTAAIATDSDIGEWYFVGVEDGTTFSLRVSVATT
jgi:hypothetical protein